MMSIKRWSKLMVVLMVLSLVLAGCGTEQETAKPDDNQASADGPQYKEMKIVITHQAPTDDPRHLGSMEIKRVLEEESGGKITVDVFPAGQLGGGREIVEAVQGGAFQMVVIPPAYMGGFQPLFTLLDIPYFLPSDYDKARAVIDGPAGKALLETLDEVNMVGLGLWDSAYKQFTANKPLRTTEDFKGLKFRVMPSDVLLKMIEALGGNAVTFDYSEVFTALQTGAIDGQEASCTSIYNMKFHEVQDYLIMTYHIKSEFLVLGSKSWFDSLDEDTKALVRKAVEAGGKVNNEAKQTQEKETEELIVKEGCEKIVLTAEEIQGLKEAAMQPCLDIYLSKNGERGQQMVDMFLQEIAKVQ